MSQRSIQLASEYAKAQSEELEEQQAEEREIIRQMENDFECGWYDDDFGVYEHPVAQSGVSFETKFMVSSYL